TSRPCSTSRPDRRRARAMGHSSSKPKARSVRSASIRSTTSPRSPRPAARWSTPGAARWSSWTPPAWCAARSSWSPPRHDPQEMTESDLDFDPEELAMLRQLFRAEAHDALETVTARVLAGGEARPSAEALAEMLRVTHTLKGAAGTVGLSAMV